MELLFLGTGASEGFPAEGWEKKENRRNSAALLNGELMIDAGRDVIHFAEYNHLPELYRHVRIIILTHSHRDHCDPANILNICRQSGATVYGDSACLRVIREKLGREAEEIRFVAMKIGETFRSDGYEITSLASNHATEDPDETTRCYVIKKEDKMLFYGCDSAWLPTRTWNAIRKLPLNALVLELTCGTKAVDNFRVFEHNTLEMLFQILRMLRQYNYFEGKAKIYTSHMAMSLHGSHKELEEILRPYGVVPAYDGLKIEI